MNDIGDDIKWYLLYPDFLGYNLKKNKIQMNMHKNAKTLTTQHNKSVEVFMYNIDKKTVSAEKTKLAFTLLIDQLISNNKYRSFFLNSKFIKWKT